MRAAFATLCLLVPGIGLAAEPQTVVERTDYQRTSLYAEVVDFVRSVASSSELVTVASLATTAEGRDVPLVILSKERVRTPGELRATGKPAVLIMANIHAGEVEGKEACQMLIRGVGSGRLAGLLERQVVLVVPIFNADGNDKLGHNRRDKGPELAGVRHNGQWLDLNRDWLKLESPEVRALVRALVEWDPVLLVDMHTTNGSYHREPLTWTTGINPNGAQALSDYMWGTLFPAVAKAVEAAGYPGVPYGNFADRTDPTRGWENDSIDARYGTNYVALRNRLAILDENYSYADFKTRVLSSYELIKAVLEFTGAHTGEIADLVRRADAETRAGYQAQAFASAWRAEPLFDVTVRSYEFEEVPVSAEDRAKYPWLGEVRLKPTERHRDYTIPYLARAVPTATVPVPAGYVILPGSEEVVELLLAHGIALERLLAPATLAAESFAVKKVEPGREIFQGHTLTTVSGEWTVGEVEVPAGAVFVDVRQPLARLLPVLLEPSSGDSLAAWGMLNRPLVRQWSSAPGVYPVLRVGARPGVPMRVESARR